MISSRFFNEVFVSQIYKPVLDLGQMDMVLDIGACTGEFSLWVQPYAKHVRSIEPVGYLYDNLKENVSDFSSIETFNIALSDKNRWGHMTDTVIGGSRLSEDTTKVDNQIEVQTLATFMTKNNIHSVDCIKIDIEGDEKFVFESDDFPTVSDKIKYIIGEHVGHVSKGVLEGLGFDMYEYKYGFIFKRTKHD